jgi:hypothetical protein
MPPESPKIEQKEKRLFKSILHSRQCEIQLCCEDTGPETGKYMSSAEFGESQVGCSLFPNGK